MVIKISRYTKKKINKSKLKSKSKSKSQFKSQSKIKLQLHKKHDNAYLKPFSRLSYKELQELSTITIDRKIMKTIGKGNIWTLEDLKKFQKEESIENNKYSSPDKYHLRNHFTYILMIAENGLYKPIGFIEGRKNIKLLPKTISKNNNYDLLMRMFISRGYAGKGFGKLIIKLFIETYSGMIKKSFKLYSDIDPDNIASIKIHLNNGFLPNGTYKYPNGKIYNRYVYSYLFV